MSTNLCHCHGLPTVRALPHLRPVTASRHDASRVVAKYAPVASDLTTAAKRSASGLCRIRRPFRFPTGRFSSSPPPYMYVSVAEVRHGVRPSRKVEQRQRCRCTYFRPAAAREFSSAKASLFYPPALPTSPRPFAHACGSIHVLSHVNSVGPTFPTPFLFSQDGGPTERPSSR